MMETITNSPAGVSLPLITVLVDVPNGLATDTVMLFGDEDYYGTPMEFVGLTGQTRKYSAEYEVAPPSGGALVKDTVFQVRVIRNGLTGPLSAPFTVSYVPPLDAPQIVNFTGSVPVPQPT